MRCICCWITLGLITNSCEAASALQRTEEFVSQMQNTRAILLVAASARRPDAYANQFGDRDTKENTSAEISFSPRSF